MIQNSKTTINDYTQKTGITKRKILKFLNIPYYCKYALDKVVASSLPQTQAYKIPETLEAPHQRCLNKRMLQQQILKIN
jgi:hypothetical protein